MLASVPDECVDVDALLLSSGISGPRRGGGSPGAVDDLGNEGARVVVSVRHFLVMVENISHGVPKVVEPAAQEESVAELSGKPNAESRVSRVRVAASQQRPGDRGPVPGGVESMVQSVPQASVPRCLDLHMKDFTSIGELKVVMGRHPGIDDTDGGEQAHEAGSLTPEDVHSEHAGCPVVEQKGGRPVGEEMDLVQGGERRQVGRAGMDCEGSGVFPPSHDFHPGFRQTVRDIPPRVVPHERNPRRDDGVRRDTFHPRFQDRVNLEASGNGPHPPHIGPIGKSLKSRDRNLGLDGLMGKDGPG